MSLLDHFPPGLTPRPAQADLLREIEDRWATTDVFVVEAPTATGKTEIQYAIAHWVAAMRRQVTLCQPTNVLVDQWLARYPVPVLNRRDTYATPEDHAAALAAVQAAPVRLVNYHTALAYRLRSHTMLFDEAHNLVDMLLDKLDQRLSQSEYRFPETLRTVADFVEWAQAWIAANPGDKADRLSRVLREVLAIRDHAAVVYRVRHGRRPDRVLHIMPQGGKLASRWLVPWPQVRKVVLLSATINAQDVAELGLAGRRVAYLRCPSPIPPDRRPLVYEPIVNMAARCRQYAIPKLAQRLRRLLETEPGKGLIHAPYEVVTALRQHLDHPRLMFHDRRNKQRVLGDFKRAAPDSGAVLVASGLYEGVDLAFDMARWQVITTVPYPYLGDARVAEKAEADPNWYSWTTIKTLVQGYGRIVRDPTDWGRTWIFDNQFGDLMRRSRELFPEYFLQAITTVGA